ncbi:MAG TPA: hypothetical protein VN706_04825 [Gemmatimonadaceae bacterium]|nr:hypothetical protein [Gemmatimonadaceae bacterium]
MTQPPPTESPQPGDDSRLGERDAELHRILEAEDPALAGLFVFLLRAIREIERPGGVHMLGHAGRELSLGVLRWLAEDGRELNDEEMQTIGDDEKHRSTIARALRLQPNHPSVTAWLKAHNELVRCAHYPKNSEKAAPASVALAAANTLLALLWGRTGPFFSARQDIDGLLRTEIPSVDDTTRLRAAISRPAARWDFFKRLDHPGWVRPLLDGGFFRHPPDLPPIDKNGQRKWEGWSEGEYLRRMASKAPEEVRDALASIPETLSNPYVWDAAAEAAKAMPAGVAAVLVPLFRKALANSPPFLIQETLCQLAISLAEAGHSEAFGLARDALRVVEGATSISALLGGGDRKDAELYGLDDYEAEQIIPHLASALRVVDADKALKFLTYRLDEALRIEWAAPEQEPAWDPSKHWSS